MHFLLPIAFLLFSFSLQAQVITEKDLRQGTAKLTSVEQLKGELLFQKGAPETHLELAKAYYFGTGTAKNYKKAKKHFKKASKASFAEADLYLAVMQIEGKGFKQNPEKGFSQLLYLAKEEMPLAQYLVSKMYESSVGTEKNLEESIFWLEKAAHNRLPVPAAQYRLGNMYKKGNPPFIVQDTQKAFLLFSTAADMEYPLARYEVAQMYFQGNGTEKNEKKAFKFMQLAAKEGLVYAQMTLSDWYQKGIGTQKDEYNAFKWMRSAAIKQNAKAQLKTALNHLNGFGTPVNRKEALFWATQAKENNHPEAEKLIQSIKEQK